MFNVKTESKTSGMLGRPSLSQRSSCKARVTMQVPPVLQQPSGLPDQHRTWCSQRRQPSSCHPSFLPRCVFPSSALWTIPPDRKPPSLSCHLLEWQSGQELHRVCVSSSFSIKSALQLSKQQHQPTQQMHHYLTMYWRPFCRFTAAQAVHIDDFCLFPVVA